MPPEDENTDREKKTFKDCSVDYVHSDVTERRIPGRKLYLFVAIDRAGTVVFCESHERMTVEVSGGFLRHLIQNCSFKRTKILTDTGSQCTDELLSCHVKPKNKIHLSDHMCAESGIEHGLTEFRHPWTNGHVEIKNHAVKKCHDDNSGPRNNPLVRVVLFYTIQKKVKSLKFKSPLEKLSELYDEKPELFHSNPLHKNRGLNTHVA